MATLYYEYDDDAGTKYGVTLNDAQQAIYPSAVGTLSTGYSSLAALQAAVSGTIPLPPGLNLRIINITDPFFGTAQLMVLTPAQFAAIEPTGATPFPLPPFSNTSSPSITGASGEIRMSN